MANIESITIGSNTFTKQKKNTVSMKDMTKLEGDGQFTITATHTGYISVRLKNDATEGYRVLYLSNLSTNIDAQNMDSTWFRIHYFAVNKGDEVLVKYSKVQKNDLSYMLLTY